MCHIFCFFSLHGDNKIESYIASKLHFIIIHPFARKKQEEIGIRIKKLPLTKKIEIFLP